MKDEEEKVAAEALSVEERKAKFFTDLKKSKDLNDNLQDLANFLAEHTEATGCYIGYLQQPEVDITDEAEDGDNFNQDAPKVIKFTHADSKSKFVVDAVL